MIARMKKILYFAAALSLAFGLVSCEREFEKTTVGGETVAPVLMTVGDVVVDANNSKAESVIFNWSPASFGAPVQIQYTLYMTNGTEKSLRAQTYSTSATVEKSSINSGAVTLGIAKNATGPVSAYVEAAVYQSGASMFASTAQSNTISFSVTTFDAPKDFIFLPGYYNGWGDSNNVDEWRVWEIEGGKKIYRTLVQLKEDETNTPGICPLKLFAGGAWLGKNDGYEGTWPGADYGDNDGNWGVPASEPINFITVDLNTKKASREHVTSVTMIGSMGGDEWKTDINFVYDGAKNIWVAGPLNFSASDEYLIRLNKSWDGEFKYGGATQASQMVAGGFELDNGSTAANIKSPGDGSYLVKLHGNQTPMVIEYEKQ